MLLMNELITACIVKNDPAPLIRFNRQHMSDFEDKLTTWILDYYADKKAMPSVARLKAEFANFLPIKPPKGLTLVDVEELTATRKKNDFVLQQISLIETQIKNDGNFEKELAENVLLSTVKSGDFDVYSEFDRMRYIREGRWRCGLKIIDHATGGLSAGDFVILVGRLGVGKSILSQFFVNNWRKDKAKILYVSNEMLSEDVFARIDGMNASVNPIRFRLVKNDEDRTLLKNVQAMITAETDVGDVYIPTQRGMTPLQVKAIAQYMDFDLIVIDGVYLMQSDYHSAAKWERLSEVSRGLKQIALSLGVPVVGITQLKRVGDKKEIDTEDIAYSDSLGQDADFIYLAQQSESDEARIEISLIKNRFNKLQMSTIARIDWETMTLIDESASPSAAAPAGKGLW